MTTLEAPRDVSPDDTLEELESIDAPSGWKAGTWVVTGIGFGYALANFLMSL